VIHERGRRQLERRRFVGFGIECNVAKRFSFCGRYSRDRFLTRRHRRRRARAGAVIRVRVRVEAEGVNRAGGDRGSRQRRGRQHSQESQHEPRRRRLKVEDRHRREKSKPKPQGRRVSEGRHDHSDSRVVFCRVIVLSFSFCR